MSLWDDLVNSLKPKQVQQPVAETKPQVEIVNQTFIPPGIKPGVATLAQADANTAGIRQTLAKYGRFDLPPGRYSIGNDIRIASGNEINGLGNSEAPSCLVPVASSKYIAERGDVVGGGEWFSVIQTNLQAGSNPRVGERYGLPEGPSHNVSISNLLIDCAFDNQVKDAQSRSKTTVQAIAIEGCGISLKNVDVVHAARGLGGGECFPIRVVAPQARVYVSARTTVERCSVSDPGRAKTTHNGGAGFEITCITVAGSPGNIIENPIIKECRVFGMPRNSSQPSPVHAYHTAYTRGAVVADNYAADVDGVGYYVDTGRSWHTSLARNQFLRVHKGVFLNAVTDFCVTDMDIRHNTIELMDTTPGWLMDNPPAGIVMQHTAAYGAAALRFDRVHAEGNTIIGRGGNLTGVGSMGYYPRGFYWRFDNRASARNLSAFRNTIDVPLFDVNPYYFQWSHSLALYFATLSAWDKTNPMVKAYGNSAPSGSKIAVTVVDDSFKPALSVEQLT